MIPGSNIPTVIANGFTCQKCNRRPATHGLHCALCAGVPSASCGRCHDCGSLLTVTQRGEYCQTCEAIVDYPNHVGLPGSRCPDWARIQQRTKLALAQESA